MIDVTFRYMTSDGEVECRSWRVEALPRVGDEVNIDFDYFIVERVTHRIDFIEGRHNSILITLGKSSEADDLRNITERKEAQALAESTILSLASLGNEDLIKVVIE